MSCNEPDGHDPDSSIAPDSFSASFQADVPLHVNPQTVAHTQSLQVGIRRVHCIRRDSSYRFVRGFRSTRATQHILHVGIACCNRLYFAATMAIVLKVVSWVWAWEQVVEVSALSVGSLTWLSAFAAVPAQALACLAISVPTSCPKHLVLNSCPSSDLFARSICPAIYAQSNAKKSPPTGAPDCGWVDSPNSKDRSSSSVCASLGLQRRHPS